MHIVHVEDFFHPDAGYQVNLLSRMQSAAGHQVTILAAELDNVPPFATQFFGLDDLDERDREFERATSVRIERFPLLGYASGRAIYSPALFRRLRSIEADVALVHGLETLTAIVCVLFRKLIGKPIVLDSHMLEMASQNKFSRIFNRLFRWLITPFIRRAQIPVARVADSDYIEKHLGIPIASSHLLPLGSDTTIFRPPEGGLEDLRRKLGFTESDFIILYAGKLDESKGGMLLAEAMKQQFEHTERRIAFLIIGTASDDFGRQVEQVMEQSDNFVVRLPTQKYFDLAQYYQLCDAAVIPAQCSLSFYDIQACGRPVLLEENEINRQRTSHGSAFTFEPQNVEALRTGLVALANLQGQERTTVCKSARDLVLEGHDFAPVAASFTDLLSQESRRAKEERHG